MHPLKNDDFVMWFYDFDIKTQIDRAISRFKEKYQKEPTHLWVKSEKVVGMLKKQGIEGNLVIETKACMLQNHFGIGIQEETGRKD